MTVRRLAWPLFALGAVTSATGVSLLALVPTRALDAEGDSLLLSLLFVLVTLVFGLVGAIIASRLPGNPIGWLFLGLWLIEGGFELAYGYTHYSLAVTSLPGEAWSAWYANWSSPVSPALIGLALLVFPDGRLLSRRWRPAAWLCVIAILPVVALYSLTPGSMGEFPSLSNPVGVPGTDFLNDFPVDAGIAAIFLVTLTSVAIRFRRSRGVERQQLKGFVWWAGLMTVMLVGSGVASAVAPQTGTADYVAGFVFAVVLCGLPVSVGVAILRYRLYDIDLVIKRTLVYGSLTAILVSTYLLVVLLLRLVLTPVIGESELAVAASTLAVAALFRPLRAQIQSVVDRRFYRSRYDAEQTLESFTGRLRDELDLANLGDDLRSVVHDTLQPAHVSLWLRSTP